MRDTGVGAFRHNTVSSKTGCNLFFVNVLGLPFNTGAAVFMVVLLALCFWGLFVTLKKKKVFWNTVLLCFTTVVIGFSVFSIMIIRSSVKTPTNEYQPDNPFTLIRYLSREQYGTKPLLYGQYFGAPLEAIDQSEYWTPLGDKYIHADGQPVPVYAPEGSLCRCMPLKARCFSLACGTETRTAMCSSTVPM